MYVTIKRQRDKSLIDFLFPKKAKSKSIELEPHIMKQYTSNLLKLAKVGPLSTKGRPKVVISAHGVQAAMSKTVDDVARDKVYTLHIISLILILHYTGVRLGSVIAPDKKYAHKLKHRSKILVSTYSRYYSQ